ncbi:hypothetical protein HXX25_02415 [Hyphobacterium sp. CCMP332]|uniref:hypothetical protein n=1 Tax=Hyphobacterium sp. CCMP332 TaxID=2749086 RepID=UPI0016503087|nr:hypothetical protein [Hyphobacterium sp. CCMP332]QNL18287.1 hypothetical protein HXX25_02415 [Hyphobacterium sp. CCMP332]
MSEAAETPPAEAELSDRELDRLWELALHEERVLNERSGYFLIAHAMLLVFAVTAIEYLHIFAVMACILIGAVMSILWLIVNARQLQEMRTAAGIVRDKLPGYVAYRKAIPSRGIRKFGPGAFAFGIPLAVAGIWLMFATERLWGLIWPA